MHKTKTHTPTPAKHSNSLLKLGKYRHYKGDWYEVIGVSLHTETREELVVYRCLYYTREFGNGALWVRPLTMFLESVEVDGKAVPRFEFVGE